MDRRDYIGKRGEILFAMLITRWCDGDPWFDVHFLGEKAEAKDFLVYLVEPTAGDAHFIVQVKGTAAGYIGPESDRKLEVRVSEHDIEKLKQSRGPAYVAGIDIENDCGYLIAVTEATTGGMVGLSTRHPINCETTKALWHEVDDYWRARKMLAASSRFSL